MRPVTINPFNVPAALDEIMRASHENDIVEMAQNFSFSGTASSVYVLTVGAGASLSNTNAVLMSLLAMLQKGGINRTT